MHAVENQVAIDLLFRLLTRCLLTATDINLYYIGNKVLGSVCDTNKSTANKPTIPETILLRAFVEHNVALFRDLYSPSCCFIKQYINTISKRDGTGGYCILCH